MDENFFKEELIIYLDKFTVLLNKHITIMKKHTALLKILKRLDSTYPQFLYEITTKEDLLKIIAEEEEKYQK